MAEAHAILADLQSRLENSPKLKGWSGTFCFEVAGEGGGTFSVAVADGSLKLQEGGGPEADCTVRLSAADLAELAAGRLNPMAAFMTGRLKVQGDMGLAMRLQGLLG